MTTRLEIQRLKRQAQQRFAFAAKAERAYLRSLMQVARQVGNILDGFKDSKGNVRDEPALPQTLARYAEILRPWARSVAAKMVNDVERRDATAWKSRSKEIGRLLKKEVFETPIGAEITASLESQVDLITSLPREAGERIHKLAMEARLGSKRPAEVAKQIQETFGVTAGRAKLIARTEVARTATEITKARSKSAGSTHYVWRTAGDSDVRETHAKLNGKVFAWDEPPVAGENGERAHPGSIYNCRCFADPILID